MTPRNVRERHVPPSSVKVPQQDDSAEARETVCTAAAAVAGTGMSPCDSGETHEMDDSAEARETTSDPCEVSEHTGSSRSLLDQLLDEADALREAEAAPSEPHEGSASEPTPGRDGRDPSVLHQRADAAKRAFDRADALVALAQGYLRGDRPNRSPIEVTVMVSATSLRAEPVDPVEAGDGRVVPLQGRCAAAQL